MVAAWTALRMNTALKEVKYELALDAIASCYRAAIGDSYRTDWGSAFPASGNPAFDATMPSWRSW
jgi:hypothetical protein